MLALALVLAACAGLRAWLPLFAAGLMGRLGVVHLGESFAWLQSSLAIALFGIATALEMLGDKIPVVDHALDAIGTVLRPLAGSLAAGAVMYRIDNPLLAGVAGLLVGAPTALLPHAVKTAARGSSTMMTAGVANPMLSLLEDMLAIWLASIAFLAPLAGVALLALLVWVVLRWVHRRRSASRA